MGKRSKNEKGRKDRIVSFRVNRTQHARLMFNAAACELSVNELARDRVLIGSRTVILRMTTVADSALIAHLHHIGHNLNQLVKNAHIFGRVSPKVEELCLRIGRIVDQAVEEEMG